MDCLRSLKNGIFPQGLPLKKNKNQKTLEKGKKQNQNTKITQKKDCRDFLSSIMGQ